MKRFILTTVFMIFLGLNVFAEETPQQFEGFDLAGYGEGNKKTWDIRGDTADVAGDTIKITNITANSYGDEVMHLTAKNGEMNKVTQDMRLRDNVVITTESGTTLVTDSLDWARAKDLVSTDDDVVITKQGMLALGKGATAQPNLKTAQLNSDVTVTMDVKGEADQQRKITATCDGPLEIDYQKQLAIFNNNVVVVDIDRKLIADKVEVFFDTQGKKVKELICTGHVQIYQGENASFSDKAVYKAAEQRVVLSGNPKLIMYMKGNFKEPKALQPKNSEGNNDVPAGN